MSAVVGGQDGQRQAPAGSAPATVRGESAAETILARVFREVPFGFAVRLWNGGRIHLGPKGEPFTLVFRTREAFRRRVLRPNTLRFALAFADGDLDVEGDFFDALHLAERIERIHLGLRDRLAILAALAKV
jgi:hypothetical protein